MTSGRGPEDVELGFQDQTVGGVVVHDEHADP